MSTVGAATELIDEAITLIDKLLGGAESAVSVPKSATSTCEIKSSNNNDQSCWNLTISWA